MNTYYVYKHIIKETGEIFYIGRGKNRRAYDKSSRNTYWKNIINKYEYLVEIIKENLGIEESKKLEIALIDHYRPRANLTEGGEGMAGYKFDPEFVKGRNQKNKDLWKDEKWVKERNENLTKAMNLPETKLNISNGLIEYHNKRVLEGKDVSWKGIKRSEAVKLQMSERQKGEKAYWYGKTTAVAKKVINLDTGEIFLTIKSAAKSVEGNRVALSRALNTGRETYKKNRFRFYE